MLYDAASCTRTTGLSCLMRINCTADPHNGVLLRSAQNANQCGAMDERDEFDRVRTNLTAQPINNLGWDVDSYTGSLGSAFVLASDAKRVTKDQSDSQKEELCSPVVVISLCSVLYSHSCVRLPPLKRRCCRAASLAQSRTRRERRYPPPQ